MKVIAALAAGLLIGTAGFAHAQTVNNPTFSQGSGGLGSWTLLGSPALKGDFSTATLSALNPPSVFNTVVDVFGGYSTVTTLQQTISGLVPGDKYYVSFWFAAAQPGDPFNTFVASFAGSSSTFDPTVATPFVEESFIATASSGSSPLAFRVSSEDGVDMYFSGVSITLIPEPISLAVLGTGLVGIGLVRRRRG